MRLRVFPLGFVCLLIAFQTTEYDIPDSTENDQSEPKRAFIIPARLLLFTWLCPGVKE
jgi:hypothetical protein